ncbi:transglutaminase-like domain-containing protein [Litorisediminicola beolgyonensis]|uniref:Transglutaminase-like domain-containing protein n=1 Tax=Litorisediminicola beolgyonensis TaxID=1173614 RepID=A0ABW3ZLT5_9RHOB
MYRRAFLASATSLLAVPFLPGRARAAFAPEPGEWRRFEVTTELQLPGDAPTDLWVPLPFAEGEGWNRGGDLRFDGTADHVAQKSDAESGARYLHAHWNAGGLPRQLTVTATVETRDRAVDLGAPRDIAPLDAAERARLTAPSRLVPTDGIVRETALAITEGTGSDLEAARAIYDWVVENTARNPETRGCGLGDVATMLETGDLTGKCADLNTLYVGLARAAGLPARDVYGLRVAPSRFGYKSLGAGSEIVTKAQHCRAEVWLSQFGWVPVDPADVRKVMLEEVEGGLALDTPKVEAARETLFGAWEGNWIAYNSAHDLDLPGAGADPVDFLMYPEAEIGGVRQDALSPDSFAYTIAAREL